MTQRHIARMERQRVKRKIRWAKIKHVAQLERTAVNRARREVLRGV